MKTIALPLFALFASFSQIASSLPIRAKIGPAILAKLPGERVDLIITPHLKGLEARGPGDNPSAAAAPGVSDAEQNLIDVIAQSMDSVIKPLGDAVSENGLKLKTTLEFEKEKKNNAGADLAGGNKFNGVKFKATVELEKPQPNDNGSSGTGDENEVDDDPELDNDEEDENELNENEPDENEVDGLGNPVDPPASDPSVAPEPPAAVSTDVPVVQ